MNCPTCGSQIPDGSTMCGVCGAAIQAQPNMQYQQPQYQQPMQQQYQQPMQQNMYAQPAMQPMMGGASSMKVKPAMNLGNIILWVGCLITAIAVFLPYVKVSAFGMSETVSLMGTDGKFTDGYIILTGVIIIAILNALKLNIPNTVLSVLELGMAFLEKKSVDDDLGMFKSYITMGPGYYLLWVGTIVMIGGAVCAIIMKGSKK